MKLKKRLLKIKRPQNIKEVIIHVPPKTLTTSYYAKPFVIWDFPHGDAIFSYPYSVATALLTGSVGLPNYTEDAIRDPRVNNIIAQTSMIEKSPEEGMGITVDIIMNNGDKFEESKGPAREWVKNPIPREKILEKFWHQVNFSRVVTHDNAEKVLKMIDNLENMDTVSNIIKILARQE